VVAAVKSYRAAQREIDDLESLIADPATDAEMRAIAESEKRELETRRTALEQELRVTLLPKDAIGRAKVRALAELIACDIHPLNNIGPLRYLKNEMHQEQAAIDTWYRHWVLAGFEALEALIEPSPYCFGKQVTLADICLVPQLYNARRLKVPLDGFPKLVGADAACMKLPAFDRARPENQPDAE